MPLLEDWGVECRLASLRGFEGVFKGFVTDLARQYLDDANAFHCCAVVRLHFNHTARTTAHPARHIFLK
jgi:hypothetical protein